METELLIKILTVTLTFTAIAVFYFELNLHSAIFWAGRAIAPEGSDDVLNRGLQDALTSKFKIRLSNAKWLLILASVVSGYFIKWYAAIAVLFIIFIIAGVLKSTFRGSLNFYLSLLSSDLSNRVADYAKAGDTMRSEASLEMSQKLIELQMEVASYKYKVPDVLDVMKMKNGSRSPLPHMVAEKQ